MRIFPKAKIPVGRPGRDTIAALALGLLFTGVVVASVAFVATHHRRPPPAGGVGAGVASTTPPGYGDRLPASGGGRAGPAPATPSRTASGAASANSTSRYSPGPPGTVAGPPACPAVTEAAVRRAGSPGGLRVVRYLLTWRSQVWICQDRAGHLWYQGRLRAYPLTAATSRYSLLLSDVTAEPGGYVATNRGDMGSLTRYHVARTELVLQFIDPAGVQTAVRTEQAVQSWP